MKLKQAFRDANSIKITNLIDKLDSKDEDILAESIGLYLREVHAQKGDRKWEEDYRSRINLLKFNHALNSKIGMKDYVLVDFIKANSFLLKARNSSRILYPKTFLDLEIKEDLAIEDLDRHKYGDEILDFIVLNRIALTNPGLSNKIVDAYFQGQVDRKFFRLLGFYTAVYCLSLLIEKDKIKNEERRQVLQEEIDEYFDMYEDFTSDYPGWLQR